jgi:hypothetical protein
MITHAWELSSGPNGVPNTPLKRQGIKYELQVGNSLCETFPSYSLIHNPWFGYQTSETGTRILICSPDYVLIPPAEANTFPLVIEVKLTFTPLAIPKLISLYVPVISLAWNKKLSPYPRLNYLLICKNILHGTPASTCISEALTSSKIFMYNPKFPIT